MVKNISFTFAFVSKNSYIANSFETLTNHWETGLMMMRVKTVVNDDYLFLLTPFPLLKTKIV